MSIIQCEEDIALALAELVRDDPRLMTVAAEAGPLPLRLRAPGFAGLAHIVVSQMVSRASAEAIWRRMIARDGMVTPNGFLQGGPQAWRGFGLSAAKAQSLARIAEAMLTGELDLEGLHRLPAAQASSVLTGVKGIGPWTAEVYLMFCCGHADLFPAGDVALQNAVMAAFDLGERPKPPALAAMSLRWSPWRSVAARLFWAYYSAKLGRGLVPMA